MGAPLGEAPGDNPCLLQCLSCGEKYETDETMPNDCPYDGCGVQRFEIIDTDPDAPWRDA